MYLRLCLRDEYYIEGGTYYQLPEVEEPDVLYVTVPNTWREAEEPRIFQPDDPLVLQAHAETCERMLHKHIFSLYPIPSQITIQAIISEAVVDGRQDIVAEGMKILAWIKQCIAIYRQHVANPSLGLPTFPEPDGLKSLSELEAM